MGQPQPCAGCGKLVAMDVQGRYYATHPSDTEPWKCEANLLGRGRASGERGEHRVPAMRVQVRHGGQTARWRVVPALHIVRMQRQGRTEMSTEVKFPDVSVQLTGRDGNVFMIMGAVTRALKQAGHADAVDEFTSELTSADSYSAALAVVMRTVVVS